jgi:hypothetical protein
MLVEFEVESGVPGLRNYVVPIPGSDVSVHMGVFDDRPEMWAYSLWPADDSLIASGWLDMSGSGANAGQVGRVAFLLEVEYAS